MQMTSLQIGVGVPNLIILKLWKLFIKYTNGNPMPIYEFWASVCYLSLLMMIDQYVSFFVFFKNFLFLVFVLFFQ